MKHFVCVKCQTAFRQVSDEAVVVDMFMDPPKPYQLWIGDLFECPGCGAQFAHARLGVARHTEPDFEHLLQKAGEGFQVRNYERDPLNLPPVGG